MGITTKQGVNNNEKKVLIILIIRGENYAREKSY